jgi:hypothetical protein
MDLTQYFQYNYSFISTLIFLVVLLVILYVVYTYLYPADDPTYTQFLKGEADARKPITLDKKKVPAIFTGGDFTFSTWIYIDDWNQRAGKHKFLFSISPDPVDANLSISPLVGVLTPLKNGLMVRAATVADGSAPSAGPVTEMGSAVPNVNVEPTLQQLLTGETSTAMWESTIDTPCDVKEVPLQRWTCITVVSTGRVLDVYMDGKLSRSCVLKNVLNVPRGPLQLRIGGSQSFGGRYSSVQMWNQQLTPDLIYGIYQMGPSQTRRDVFTDLAKFFGLNVTFTGPTPGSTVQTKGPFDWLSGESTGSCDLQSLSQSAYRDLRSQAVSFAADTQLAYDTRGESVMARL